MRSKVVALFLLSIAVLLNVNSFKRTQAQTKGSTLTLSPGEQEVLNEINQLRQRPAAYITYLEGLKPRFKGMEYTTGDMALTTKEGWNAVEDAIRFLKTAKPQGPLKVSNGLCMTASVHVKDQSGSGSTGHLGGGGMIEQRAKAFGIWSGAIGENLSYGNESARDRVLTWLIDDGFATRGHRKRLLSGDYGMAGLSCGAHPEYQTMCVLTLAGGFTDASSAKSAPTKTSPSSSKPSTSSKTRKM